MRDRLREAPPEGLRPDGAAYQQTLAPEVQT
jgi:hypothetical protein